MGCAIRNRIRELRAEAGDMTQQTLATHIGVTRQTVNAIELGKYVPSAALAMKIARVFGKKVEEVFELEEGD